MIIKNIKMVIEDPEDAKKLEEMGYKVLDMELDTPVKYISVTASLHDIVDE